MIGARSPTNGRLGGASLWDPLSALWLGVSDGLVGEVGEVVIDGAGFDQAQGFLVAGFAEEPLAGAEHDRVDHQPQLVDEVVL